MKFARQFLISASVLSFCMSATASAHGGGYPPPPPPVQPPTAGGTYNGPGDTVPQGGPSTPGATGPAAPGPGAPGASGPNTPGSAGPAPPQGGQRGPSTPSGLNTPDLSEWVWWWNFNRDPYLEIKRHVLGGGVLTGSDDFFLGHGQDLQQESRFPSLDDLRTMVGPALQRAIESDSWKVRSDALMAIAKLHPAYVPQGTSMLELIRQYVAAPNQKLAESAIVALGIMGDRECIRILADIAADNESGRKWIGRTSVPSRTRPLAALAMGILAPGLENQDARRLLVGRLAALLLQPEGASPDLHVACLTSIGQTALAESARPSDQNSDRRAYPSSDLRSEVTFLIRVLQDEQRHEYVRAHAPRAVALLLASASRSLRDEGKSALLVELKRHKRKDRLVRYGIVEALGMLGDADDDRVDARVREALHRSVRDGDNNQRGISLIAIALASSRPGHGNDVFAALPSERQYLLKQLANGKSRLRPWTALALGLQAYHARQAQQRPSKDVALALRMSFKNSKSPADSGAWSIALGLLGDSDAHDKLVDRLERKGDDNARGFAAIGLGLAGDFDARDDLERVIEDSKFRPIPLRKASVALALLDQKGVVPTLFKALEGAKSSAVKSSLLASLGLVGDLRVVKPLVAILDRDQELLTTRRFSAIALGVVCEKESLPWTAGFANHVNYFAMTETLLTGKGTGLLNLR